MWTLLYTSTAHVWIRLYKCFHFLDQTADKSRLDHVFLVSPKSPDPGCAVIQPLTTDRTVVVKPSLLWALWLFKKQRSLNITLITLPPQHNWENSWVIWGRVDWESVWWVCSVCLDIHSLYRWCFCGKFQHLPRQSDSFFYFISFLSTNMNSCCFSLHPISVAIFVFF